MLISSTRDDSNPQYSPDGRRIAFASNRSGAWEIWVCNRDGSGPVRLTNFGTGVSAWPSWSPDGKRITFNSNGIGKGTYQLFTLSAQGRPAHQLTTEPGDNSSPSWSTDGWIYFQSDRDGEMQIWKIPETGGAAVRVTKHGGRIPAATSDGKFVSTRRARMRCGALPRPEEPRWNAACTLCSAPDGGAFSSLWSLRPVAYPT